MRRVNQLLYAYKDPGFMTRRVGPSILTMSLRADPLVRFQVSIFKRVFIYKDNGGGRQKCVGEGGYAILRR